LELKSPVGGQNFAPVWQEKQRLTPMICNEIAGSSITTQIESTKQIQTSTYVLKVTYTYVKAKGGRGQKKDESQSNINNSPSNKSQQRSHMDFKGNPSFPIRPAYKAIIVGATTFFYFFSPNF
jgi:hypothetical protein